LAGWLAAGAVSPFVLVLQVESTKKDKLELRQPANANAAFSLPSRKEKPFAFAWFHRFHV
jgi:hypothetical protein